MICVKGFRSQKTGYSKLERTYKDHQVQLLVLPAQGTPKESHCVPESIAQILLEFVRGYDYFPGEPPLVPNHPLG